jgi:phosphohistidine phosphatase
MKHILMQHGDAVSTDIDPQRPLSDSGRRDVVRLAAILARVPASPSRIVHSGKTRARQTAELIGAAASPAAVIEVAEGLGPNDPVEPWATSMATWVEPVAIVGHLPFVGRLAAQLVVGSANADLIAFVPGSVLCVEQQSDGRWKIAWMLRPDIYRHIGGSSLRNYS